MTNKEAKRILQFCIPMKTDAQREAIKLGTKALDHEVYWEDVKQALNGWLNNTISPDTALNDIYRAYMGKGDATMTDFDIKTIQEAITRFDIMLRPSALLLSPSRVSELKELIPDIEEKVLLVPSEMVPDDKFYLIDRKELTPEHYLTGGIE